MTELDMLLERTAQAVPTPDANRLGAMVADRLRTGSTAGIPWWASTRHRVGAVVAGLVTASAVLIGTVAPVRSAVADLVGVDGVHINRVARPLVPPPTLPVDPVAALHLGRATTLVGASNVVGFVMRVPATAAYAQPDAVYVGTPPAGGMASMVYLPRRDRPASASVGVAALLTEFRGQLDGGYFQKLVGAGTTVEAVRVGSAAGYWVSGPPHEFFYVGPDGNVNSETIRLAGDTLLWSAGGITYRFESGLSRDAAIAVATSVR